MVWKAALGTAIGICQAGKSASEMPVCMFTSLDFITVWNGHGLTFISATLREKKTPWRVSLIGSWDAWFRVGMSMKMFPEEIRIWVGGLSKAAAPPPPVWAASSLWRPEQGQNGRGRVDLASLPASWAGIWLCWPRYSCSQACRLRLEATPSLSSLRPSNYTPAFLNLQLVDSRLGAFSASVIIGASSF